MWIFKKQSNDQINKKEFKNLVLKLTIFLITSTIISINTIFVRNCDKWY
jgi:hypothetical protein